MTYPPPPGPGGWGQPPQGPYGPPGGQFPPTGPPPGMPQQPYGNPPPPPPGPFPPSGPMPAPSYGIPQGNPPGPPWGVPPRQRSPLPWILGGGAGLILVIVVVVVLVVALGGGSSPQAVAQQAVDAINTQNTQEMSGVVCAQDLANLQRAAQESQQLEQQLPDLPERDREAIQNMKLHATLGPVTKDSDSHATADITMTWQNVPTDLEDQGAFSRPIDAHADVIKDNGDWKLCNLGSQSSQFGG